MERFLDGEQDSVMCKELAEKHAVKADEAMHDTKAVSRADAFRNTLKALALDPDNTSAQKLLVGLLTDVSGKILDKARKELSDANDHARAEGAKIALGALAPFVVEIAGWLPRAYTFEVDRLIVVARGVALPEGATHAAMIYSTLGFLVLTAMLMGRLRDALQALEERRFLQA